MRTSEGANQPCELARVRQLTRQHNRVRSSVRFAGQPGGFTKPVHERNEQQSFFAIRLWGPDELAQRLLENYDSLPQDIQADFRTDLPVETARILQRQGADF